MWQQKRHFMYSFSDIIFLMSQLLVNCHVTNWKGYRFKHVWCQNLSNILTDIRAHFIIKNRIAKNNVVSL